jgi:hypothetical protein
MTPSHIVTSLAVMFAGLWLCSAAFWVGSYDSWNAAAHSAIAPLVGSTQVSSGVAASSAGVSAFALVMVGLALWRPQSRIASGLAHLGLALYFGWSLMLIGIGV